MENLPLFCKQIHSWGTKVVGLRSRVIFLPLTSLAGQPINCRKRNMLVHFEELRMRIGRRWF